MTDQLITLLSIPLIIGITYILAGRLIQMRFDKLKRKEKKLRQILHTSPLPVLMIDKNSNIIFVSNSTKKQFKSDSFFKKNDNLFDYLHPEDAYIYDDFIKELTDNPDQNKTKEVRFRKNENEWLWISIQATNLLSNQHVNAIVAVISDVTQQKDMEKQRTDMYHQEKSARAIAEKAIQDRDAFISIASHELKTPLTTVLLQLQATLRKISTQSLADFSGKELLNSLQIAEKQSQSLSILIKDLLDVSIASADRLTLNKQTINLADLVEFLDKRFQEERKLHNCDVEVHIINKEIIGDWDPIRIEQAISNLFSNALKYSNGKKVIVSTFINGDWGIFSVKDHGIGIPQNLLEEIFKPFKRVNERSNIKGLGVGLFISKRIAQSHGGDITVDSKEGVGSTFQLSLPLKKF